MQTAPPVLLLPSGGQITGATVSVLKEYLSAQGTQPEARALRPQLVTLAQECRAAQLIVEDRYFVTNDPIRDMRVSSIKEAISHLGGVPHAGALKPALVSQLVALNADGLSSVTDSPENTLGGGPEAALPPNFVTPASSALTIISDHVDASTGDILVSNISVLIPALSPLRRFCSEVNEAWVGNTAPPSGSPGLMQGSLLTMVLGFGCSPGSDVNAPGAVPIGSSLTMDFMNNLIANISSALDAVDNAPTCLKDLVSTMSNLVSSLPLELRSFSRTDFDLCVIDPGGSETPSFVHFASIGTLQSPRHWLVLNHFSGCPRLQQNRDLESGECSTQYMNHELSSALVPTHLQATGVPLPLRVQASLARFCDFEPTPLELTGQLPVSMAEYIEFRSLQEGLKSGDESSLFLAVPAYLQRGLFPMLQQIFFEVPPKDFSLVFHRLAQVMAPDSPPVSPTLGALSKLESATKQFAYCFHHGLGPGAGSESTPLQVGSTDSSLEILTRMEAEKEKVASFDRSHNGSSSSRSPEAQRSVTVPQNIIEILSAHAGSLASICSFGLDESGQLQVIHTALSSGCSAISKFLWEPPSETLARHFPALPVVFLSRFSISLYASHQLLKKTSLALPGASASLTSALESSQRDSNFSTLAKELPPKELIAILKGEFPPIAALVTMFSARRRVTSIANSFLSVTSFEVFSDLALFRSFVTFLIAIFASLGFNASDLNRLVGMADLISETLCAADSLHVFSLNLPVALQSSLDAFGNAIQLWRKISNSDLPPILSSQVNRLEEVLNSAAALSVFNGLAHLGLPTPFGGPEQPSSKRPIVHEVKSAGDPLIPSPGKKAKQKPSFGRSDAQESYAKSTEAQGSHAKALVIKKCKDVGDVVKWKDCFSLAILKEKWEASSKESWRNDFLSPILYRGSFKEEIINRTPSSVSAAELRDIISFRSSGALAAAKLEAEPPDFR